MFIIKACNSLSNPTASVSAQSYVRAADVPNQSNVAVMVAEEAIYHRLKHREEE
jgi:hypothetical protein